VHPDWLKDLVPAFRRSCASAWWRAQEHRDGDRS